jgi:hypothetical protein
MSIISLTQIIDNLVTDYRSLVWRLFPDEGGRECLGESGRWAGLVYRACQALNYTSS